MPGTTPAATSHDVVIEGGLHITVQGGDTSDKTIQAIKDSIGSWFQQAVHQVANGARVSKGLGGNYAS